MPLRRTGVELSLEREVEGPGGRPERVRITARFDGEVSEGDLRAALDHLRGEWAQAVGEPARGPRPDRSLPELVEIYRPRQVELVELLRADDEISEPEAQLLRGYLARGSAEPAASRPEPVPPVAPLHDRPLAAMPLANDRTPATARPIAELIELYRIDNLRQAGAVRARRQISYEEYMALKRHFAAAEARAGSPPSPGASSDTGPPAAG